MNVDFISNFLHLIFFLPFSVIVIFTCMCWMYWKYVKHANVKMRKSEWERERGACIFYLFLYYIVKMLRTIVEERCYYFLCAEHALLRKNSLSTFINMLNDRERKVYFLMCECWTLCALFATILFSLSFALCGGHD